MAPADTARSGPAPAASRSPARGNGDPGGRAEQAAQAGNLAALRSLFRAAGRVQWIGVRTARRATLAALDAVEALAALGLAGDHTRGGRRGVTLIQHEHLPAIAALSGLPAVPPALLRRNLAVSGVNLLALRDARFRIGEAVFEGTGICAPCSRMGEAGVLGPGGYNAMRGHGGITAQVIEGGRIALGDPVTFIELLPPANVRGAASVQQALAL